jgi:CDP-glycerol glycerophosphotransferase
MTVHLSVIVAAHDVEPYLERCLASIPDRDDVEVVVVDDGSADGTAAVAAAHDRVRLVHHDTARGPGLARNAGVAVATGEHVWFVDGDDWLLEGAIEAVLPRVADVDVLLVDHVRTYPSGRVAPSSSRPLLQRAPSAPFTLAAWPALVDVLHVPWNKIVRRSLVVPFSDAPVYEDVAFTFGVLRRAERIAVLAEPPVYSYRTARPGALTRTQGERHLVWAREWRRALDDAAEDPPQVREALQRRMREHGWNVLGVRNGWRLRHPGLRRTFIERFRALDATVPSWPLAEATVAVGAVRWVVERIVARLRRRPSS